MNQQFLERANKKIVENEQIGIHECVINGHVYQVNENVFSPKVFLGA